jgi:hypothetical protein
MPVVALFDSFDTFDFGVCQVKSDRLLGSLEKMIFSNESSARKGIWRSWAGHIHGVDDEQYLERMYSELPEMKHHSLLP